MTTDPRAFLALDLGTATSSAALVGRVDGRWRLLGATAGPSTMPLEPAIARLVATVRTTDPELAQLLRLPEAEAAADEETLPRLVARTRPAPRLAVVTAGARQLGPLLALADRAGWRASGLAAETADAATLTGLLLERDLVAVLVGSDERPSGRERRSLTDLARLVAAAGGRHPELDIILAGASAAHASLFEPRPGQADPNAGSIVLGPALDAGEPAGEPLRLLLERLRTRDDDARAGVVRATASLARVLDRRLETIEIGAQAGLRAVARPGDDSGTGVARGDQGRVDPSRAAVRAAVVASATLLPEHPDDRILDEISAWSTIAVDRHRLRDRLRDLRRSGWGDVAGDGALLRVAAARAAVGRLLAATPDLEPLASPDLVVAAGGAWAVCPGPVVALALADLVRRPGVSQYAYDHARLLGPLGTIADEAERQRMLADLVDDLLVPLGSVVIAGEVRAGRNPAGRAFVRAGGEQSELDLVAGGLQLVDLPPGRSAIAELRFRDPVVIGARGRRFEVEVSGGLGGLVVDLRDVPLRFPERSERRRQVLAAWQGAFWPGLER